MNQLLEIIHITLVSISKSVYNLWFFIVLWIIFFLTRKIKSVNFYNYENAKSTLASFVESILQGVIIGILGSFIVVFFGLPIHLSVYLAFLLPISLALSLINLRYICISYSASFLGILALIFKGGTLFGLTLPDLDININGLMALVGVFHLMESVLIFTSGAEDSIPVVCKKDDKIIMGHLLQKYWPVPIALLFITAGVPGGDAVQMPLWWPVLKPSAEWVEPIFYGLIPLVGVLSYNTVTFTEEPEKRTKKTAIMLFGYSVLIIAIAVISGDNWILNGMGLLLTATLHEGIAFIEQRHERTHAPIYTVPDQGVRIMYIVDGSQAEAAGLKRGAIIKKINNIELLNVQHFKTIINQGLTFLWFEVESLDGLIRTHEINATPQYPEQLGIKLLPEHPRILFKYEHLNRFGLFHFLRRK